MRIKPLNDNAFHKSTLSEEPIPRRPERTY